jgi:hypothetical protein
VPVSTSLPAGTTVTAIAAGGNYSLARTSTGQVLAWGDNALGQLGNGTNTDSNVPISTSLPAGTTVTAIAAGFRHSLAATSTGQALAWGDNTFGQLGNGTNTGSNVPVSTSLPAGTTVTAVAAGGDHSLALTVTGQVLAWGRNNVGQLGNGTNTDSNVPVSTSLPAGTAATAIAAGNAHCLALSTSVPPPTTVTTTTTVTGPTTTVTGPTTTVTTTVTGPTTTVTTTVTGPTTTVTTTVTGPTTTVTGPTTTVTTTVTGPTTTVTKTVTKTTTKTTCCHEENDNNDDSNEDHEHEDNNKEPWRLPMAR